MFMDYNELKILFQKYQEGKITREEFYLLQKQVNMHSDKTLQPIFEKQWEQFEEYIPLSSDKQEMLYTRILSSRDLPKGGYYRNWWIRIAASILILFTMGWAFSLYNENQQMQQLTERNVVIKAGDSPSSIILPDGTNVKLNSYSSLSYRSDFGVKARTVSLSGEGYFEVKRDETRQFVVKTNHIDIKVLGTKFNVHAYEDEDFLEMALLEGSVQVNTIKSPYRSLVVKPKEKVVYNKAEDKLILKVSDNDIETAWLSDILIFQHDTLRYVLDCLERKYRVTFHVEDDILLSDIYTGAFDEKDIIDILEILKIHYHFDYVKEDSNIYLKARTEP